MDIIEMDEEHEHEHGRGLYEYLPGTSRLHERRAFVKDIAVSACISACGSYLPMFLFKPSQQELDDREIPYQTTSSGEIILDFSLNHPWVKNVQVPGTLLVVTSLYIPLIIISIVGFLRHKSLQEVQAGICGLLTAIGISEGFTSSIKLYVHRRRPNFYALCDFSIDLNQCTGSYKHQLESQISFPSGHSSESFCGMTYLALFFLGMIGIRRHRQRSRRRLLSIFSCVIPLSWCSFVASSRIVDNWHHVSDVVAGSLIGFCAATFSYYLFHPHVLSQNVGTPLLRLTQQESLTLKQQESMDELNDLT
jgi:membrane-associated phospholipid phosphatase